MVLTDAIRPDYLSADGTPFLWHLSETCSRAKSLRPSFGFCERVEFFTGTHPDTNGYFCALTLGEGSKFSSLETGLFRLFDWDSDILRRQIRRGMRGWFHRIRKIRQPIYEIPMRLLPRIKLTEDEFDFFTDLGKHSVETLFDVMTREGRTYLSDAFISLRNPVADDESFPRAMRGLETPHHLHLLYQGMGDVVGHAHGPDSPEIRETAREVDRRVEKVVTAFREKYPDGRFVVHGDHGMVKVEEKLDVGSIVKRVAKDAGLRMGRDFELWLDSTLLRLWLRTDRARDVLTRWLAEDETMNTHGGILTAERCKVLHVPPPGGIYGDLLWLANPGVLVFPDFFRRTAPAKGMHGYETHIPAQQTYAIWHHPDVERVDVDQIEGVDICALLSDMIGIAPPRDCVGKSPLRGAQS